MFYLTKVKDHVRVSPDKFGKKVEEAVISTIKGKYEGYISKELGIVIDVCSVDHIKDGAIIPGDGAAHYETVFNLMTFRPELQEVVMGKVRDIADFGAFLNIGPIDGMIHISQTMNDFVSFGKDKVLIGKDTKRALKVGDVCRARVIAVSYKDPSNPKLGLTMRQPYLGKLEWDEPAEKKGAPEEAEEKPKKEKGKK